MARSLLVLVSALLLAARADVLLDQNATSDTTGTRNLPQARMWQSFTPHSSGSLLTVDVYVGVSSATCEPLSAVLLIVDGLPTSFDDLTTWADLSSTATPPAALLHRQSVTTTCATPTCNQRECLGWESLGLDAAVTLTANHVVSFALLHVQPTTVGSVAHPRVGVVPVVAGSTGRSSLLVSPTFHTRFGQYAFRAYLDDNLGTSGQAGASSGMGAKSSDSSTAGTASYAVAIGVVGAVALIALVSLLVVRSRRASTRTVNHSNPVMTAEELRLASPQEAWNYLHNSSSTSTLVKAQQANPRKLTIAESDVDSQSRRSSMRYHDDSEYESETDDASHAAHRGQVTPVSGTSHTLAWQPTPGFGPVQRISVSSASSLSATPNTTTTTTATTTPAASADAKKRRRLPEVPATHNSASAAAVTPGTPKAPKPAASAAWGEESTSTTATANSTNTTAAPASDKSKGKRPAVIAEEDVDFDFLPPFTVNEGRQS